jgi:2C-methyl-D-erythritol 2,4-cyclodiphosphate synthase
MPAGKALFRPVPGARAELVAQSGHAIAHVDVTIICEAPKIGPHKATMRARLAEICN